MMIRKKSQVVSPAQVALVLIVSLAVGAFIAPSFAQGLLKVKTLLRHSR